MASFTVAVGLCVSLCHADLNIALGGGDFRGG